MTDGNATRRRAADLGVIQPGIRSSLVNTDTLTAQERSDWFRFRATGRQLNRFIARAAHGSTFESNEDEGETTGFTATTKMTFFFQRQGSGAVNRLGVLRSANRDIAGNTPGFIYPKGEGTYYVKISRAGRNAPRGDIEYSFLFNFSPSNLSTDDQPDGRPFFF